MLYGDKQNREGAGRRTLGGMCFRYKQSGQESLAEKMLLGKDVILEAGSEP